LGFHIVRAKNKKAKGNFFLKIKKKKREKGEKEKT